MFRRIIAVIQIVILCLSGVSFAESLNNLADDKLIGTWVCNDHNEALDIVVVYPDYRMYTAHISTDENAITNFQAMDFRNSGMVLKKKELRTGDGKQKFKRVFTATPVDDGDELSGTWVMSNSYGGATYFVVIFFDGDRISESETYAESSNIVKGHVSGTYGIEGIKLVRDVKDSGLISRPISVDGDVLSFTDNGDVYKRIDTPTAEIEKYVPSEEMKVKQDNENSDDSGMASEQIELLQIGSNGAEVVKVQEALIKLGYLNGKADGDYGKKTANAVRAFQAAEGLDETGIVGALTRERLFEKVK